MRLAPHDLAVRRLSLWLLGGWVALIASASLYPFDGQLRLLADALITGLPKLREWRDPSQRDTIVNLLLYVPLGLLGYMAFEKSRSVVLRVFLPVGAATVLSLGIEVAQHALPARDPSLADWIFNIVSAGLGIVFAMLYSTLPVRPLSRRLQRMAIGPAPALLVALWLIAHLAPFVPRLRPGRIEAAIETSLAIPFEPGKMFGFFACYLVLGTLVDTLLRRPYFWSALLTLFAISLGARLLFVGQHLSPAEGIALILSLVVITTLRSINPGRWESRAFVVACGALFLTGVWPSPHPVEMATGGILWLPFAELAGVAGDPGALPLLERLFLGVGLAWLALHGGSRSLPPFPLVILIAISTEFLQQWIPGRLPDTSDVAALLIGAALAQARNRID
jgi:VanZ family protein